MAEWLQSLSDASVPFIVWLQGFRSGFLDSFMRYVTYLGTEYFYLLFVPFLYWAVAKRLGILGGLALMVSSYVGELIKYVFKLPRPPSPPVEKITEETSPGFVSTHASTSLGVWGTLAVAIRKTWFTILAIVIILLVSLSRPYLGVHYPTDVIGGWLVGLLAMWIVLWLAPRVGRIVQGWPVIGQTLGAAVLAAVMIAVMPSDLEGRYPNGTAVLQAGVLFGFLIGLIWDQQSLRFQVDGPWTRRILRYILGVIIILAVYLGLDYVFDLIAGDNYYLQQGLRFVRYAAVGITISGFGPWLFQRLRLSAT